MLKTHEDTKSGCETHQLIPEWIKAILAAFTGVNKLDEFTLSLTYFAIAMITSLFTTN